MNEIFYSVFFGLFFLALFFIVCFFLVLGVKFAFNQVLESFFKKQPQKKSVSTPKKVEVKSKTPRTVRSIEINPEEVDRIYVRKFR